MRDGPAISRTRLRFSGEHGSVDRTPYGAASLKRLVSASPSGSLARSIGATGRGAWVRDAGQDPQYAIPGWAFQVGTAPWVARDMETPPLINLVSKARANLSPPTDSSAPPAHASPRYWSNGRERCPAPWSPHRARGCNASRDLVRDTSRKEIKNGNLRVRRIGRCVRILDGDLASKPLARRIDTGRGDPLCDWSASLSRPA